MDKRKNCTVCNMKLEVVNYLKQRTVCRKFYKTNRRKNNNNSHHNQKSKLLITITRASEPQSSTDKVLAIIEILKPRTPRSTRT